MPLALHASRLVVSKLGRLRTRHRCTLVRSVRSRPVFIECASLNHPECPLHGRSRAFPCWRKESRLGSAPEAWPKPGGLGGGRRWKEHYIPGLGRTHRAYPTAVDLCRSDAREKSAVISTIPSNTRSFAFGWIQHSMDQAYRCSYNQPTMASESGEPTSRADTMLRCTMSGMLSSDPTPTSPMVLVLPGTGPNCQPVRGRVRLQQHRNIEVGGATLE